ncbi:hypothetical protein K469DRAFT_704045 [Zopfia rhizophila CBS 207.26]|uniref:Uncharacterized protein n=1 Tax=Zopfia rhizophila CBS 207.26 TaxID=1314779 RepID=A0A6A6D5Z5_9PEZI|nr:hypothetical protein K469DRAFT_704045 [Zopfia rhizophila CBS 207.26]
MERDVNNWLMDQENVEIAEQEAGMRQRAIQPDHENPLPSGRRRMPRRPEWEFKLERAVHDKKGRQDYARDW